jgi:hypothetical protein
VFYWKPASATRILIGSIALQLLQLTFTIARQAKRFFQATQHEKQFSIMFMRYLNLAILASTALSQSVPEPPTATAWLVSSGTLTGT